MLKTGRKIRKLSTILFKLLANSPAMRSRSGSEIPLPLFHCLLSKLSFVYWHIPITTVLKMSSVTPQHKVRIRGQNMLWPGSFGLCSISTPREHILDSVEVPVFVNLVLFHSWKPYFFTVSLIIFQTVSLSTAFQQMKTCMGKQCRCGCTGCSVNHQNSFEGHEQQWHIWRGCLNIWQRLPEVIESIIKIPWTVCSIPTVLQFILIFFIGNYIFLLFNERLLKWSLFCPSLKMVEINFFTDMNKGQILQWTIYTVIVYWGLWSRLGCKLLIYVAQ